MGLNGELGGLRLSRFIKSCWRRGRSGSGAWMALAVVATTMRVLRHLSARRPTVVHTRQLLPGESVRIDHLPKNRSESQ